MKSRLEKATAAAHAKQRVTFNSDIQVSVTKPKAKARANGVELETGDTPTTSLRKSGVSKTRTSKRMHTVLNTTATVTRLKESEQKRVCQFIISVAVFQFFSRQHNPGKPRQNPERTLKVN
jgi:vacuolar protein sorting-associated protein 72